MSDPIGNRIDPATRPTRMRRLTAALLGSAILLTLAACGDDSTEPAATSQTGAAPTSAAPAPFVALRHTSDGGCQVMGPNCPTYVVWSDGRVELFRTGTTDDGAVLTGEVPSALVTEWLDAVHDLDVDALAAAVGPGTCNSCVDGADVVVVTATDHGDATLDSTKMAFDLSNPVFAALERLMKEVLTVGPMPLVTIG